MMIVYRTLVRRHSEPFNQILEALYCFQYPSSESTSFLNFIYSHPEATYRAIPR